MAHAISDQQAARLTAKGFKRIAPDRFGRACEAVGESILVTFHGAKLGWTAHMMKDGAGLYGHHYPSLTKLLEAVR